MLAFDISVLNNKVNETSLESSSQMRSSWGEEKKPMQTFTSCEDGQRTTEHSCYFLLTLHSERLSSKLACAVQEMARFRQGSQVILDLMFTKNLQMHLTC